LLLLLQGQMLTWLLLLYTSVARPCASFYASHCPAPSSFALGRHLLLLTLLMLLLLMLLLLLLLMLLLLLLVSYCCNAG
jgi:hypothetical protein